MLTPDGQESYGGLSDAKETGLASRSGVPEASNMNQGGPGPGPPRPPLNGGRRGSDGSYATVWGDAPQR